MNKEEYIKHKKEQFEKNLENAFDENKLYVIIFTDNQQSSCYGHYEYCDMYCGCDNTWRDNIKNLLAGKLKYYKMTVNKWITYKCECGCNTFYCYKDMPMTGTVGMNTWHRFGLISKYEFDEFMKNCTNPEQEVYW